MISSAITCNYITWRESDGGRLWLKHVVTHNESMSEMVCRRWQNENTQEPSLIAFICVIIIAQYYNRVLL
jgi:hypothetical protein